MNQLQPKVQIFSADDVPPLLACQIRSFIRIAWYDAYRYEGEEAPIVPVEWNPTLVLLADKDVLISYAGVVWRNVEFEGVTYKLYGLTGVFTYPAFRGYGYGGQVVSAATTLIDHDPAADMALLWTDPFLEDFYASTGWEHIPTISVLLGDRTNPSPRDGDFTMMRFISEKGNDARWQLENRAFYFADHSW